MSERPMLETITDDDCPCLKPSHKRLESDLAAARNALERIAAMPYGSRAQELAREVLARLDGSSE